MTSDYAQELDIAQLLMVIHHYFMSLGVDEIRRRGARDDKSLRMVKSILHELTKVLVSMLLALEQYNLDVMRECHESSLRGESERASLVLPCHRQMQAMSIGACLLSIELPFI